MQLIILTPHPFTLYGPDGEIVIDLPASEPMARCAESRTRLGTVLVDGHAVPLNGVGFGAVTDLPAPRDGVLYVVSRATAERAGGRDDVVYPDEPVRDKDKRIIGCRAIARALTGTAAE